MKTLYYALASIRYHKKLSLIYGLFFGLFLFLFTFLLNLKETVLLLHSQVSTRMALMEAQVKEAPPSMPLDNQQVTQVTQLYQMVLYGCIGVFLLITLVMLSFFFRYKKKELLQWRIVGLRYREILRLLIVESMLPAVAVAFLVTTSLFVFQNTYETLLQTANLQILNSLNLDHYPAVNLATDSQAFIIGLPFDQVSLFQVDFTNHFWSSAVFVTALKVCGVMILSISFLVSCVSLSLIKHWTKKGRWTV
ncbi:hypothetical protein BAU15_07120 [Enterococcus sp. JM4C]|uniref:hypothetical protein n=1 Tax=Candidatus Enterococcus huntleyi TaxID=1857217 RepID=UPI0013798F1E|nr:hypothetical protein [Enterococcus sp. JM4C]KAF1297479.1 hypothetical protein BAU15_07120 [Enterococcus sp. JM4C]